MTCPIRFVIVIAGVFALGCGAVCRAGDDAKWLRTLAEKIAWVGGAGVSRDGRTITFDGEEYLLKTNQSFPGQATSELREYLRQGEDWDGYRKMVSLRMMSKNIQGGAGALAENILKETEKAYPGCYVRKILLKPDHAITFYIITSGSNVELNFWDFRKTDNGYPSAQFVLRNKAPYDSPAKFKGEQDARGDAWMAGIAALASRAEEILAATGREATGVAPGAVDGDSTVK